MQTYFYEMWPKVQGINPWLIRQNKERRFHKVHDLTVLSVVHFNFLPSQNKLWNWQSFLQNNVLFVKKSHQENPCTENKSNYNVNVRANIIGNTSYLVLPTTFFISIRFIFRKPIVWKSAICCYQQSKILGT